MPDDPIADFHPVIQTWFRRRFRAPTDAQAAGWPVIRTGRDVLIAAPTGSGKTLAAFLAGLDSLIQEAASGDLPNQTRIVYISPLKALGNDIQRNLEAPLDELRQVALEMGYDQQPAARKQQATGNRQQGDGMGPVAGSLLPVAPSQGVGWWPQIRTAVRTGDTPAKDRQAIVKSPPHILITTPESLYLMLTAARSRETLRHVTTVIVDEIHALARDKRGSHLTLSLARLDHICENRPARIGLSATQKPVDEIAAFLVGTDHAPTIASEPTLAPSLQAAGFKPQTPITSPTAVEAPSMPRPSGRGVVDAVTIVDLGHQRDIDLHVEVPPSDLEAVAAKEQWSDIYDRLAALIRAHRTTLVFVNTRRLSERVAHNLRERLGGDGGLVEARPAAAGGQAEGWGSASDPVIDGGPGSDVGAVASHHGSLSRDRRLRVEQRLKAGDLKALVCTASLELGIDIGAIDLVCQIGSPRGVATFLQRVGRSGHALGLRPHGRLFPTSRDELVECAALVRAVRAGRLDRITQPTAPLDILAQQIVAETACEDWHEDALFDLVRRAWPYRDLSRDDYEDVLEMLAEGVGDGAGRAPPLIYRDRINHVLRGRRGARMSAILNGGAIPEMADYRVVAEPDDTMVGTVNEDWAIESMAGDIFLLGSHSWRIKRVAAGEVRVEDAQGAPPTIPFWLGEAPGRTRELSQEVARLRRDVVAGLDDVAGLTSRLKDETGLDDLGAVQVVDYLRASRDALGVIPTDTDVVFERFFDETGGMQLVVHAPFGARINRAWGLVLRKRFCVRFDFELQAAAGDDALVLSLGPQHSFPLEESFDYVTSRNAEPSLRQAILYAPVFPVRWRWDAGRALAVPRFSGARKVPPQIQRMRADDLLAAVFPAQVGCQENVTGPLEFPDHPLIRQTVHDCLHEAMDLDGLLDVLRRIEAGEIRLHAIDTLEPSPMAHEILSGKPYTYLDDAPLEERRTRAVTLRRALPESARELGALDQDAIDRVRDEAWPAPRDPEETHDALLSLVAVPAADAAAWQPHLDDLIATGRAAWLTVAQAGNRAGLTTMPRGSARGMVANASPSISALPLLPGEGRGEVVEQPATEGRVTGAASLEAAGFNPQTPVNATNASASGSPSPQTERGMGGEVAFAAENLNLVRLLYPEASIAPQITPPEAALVRAEDRDEARLRLLRGWTEAAGPITAAALAARLGLDAADLDRGLRMVEASGFVLRGHFSPGIEDDEYCDRRLLARIHRYTLDRLRREIDPVSAQDFMRFLLRWQHLTPDSRLAGKQGVRQAVARLQGFEAAAGAWERELLAARVGDYRSSWLDELCLAGEVAWSRLTPRKTTSSTASATATRATPVALCLRPDFASLLVAVRGTETVLPPKAGAAAEIHAALQQRGALFFDEIVNATRRLGSDVERGLRELIAWGLVASDGFQGLRQLSGRAAHTGRNRARDGTAYSAQGFFTGGGPAGRWALVHAPLTTDAREEPATAMPRPSGRGTAKATGLDNDDHAEAIARVLLQRYGVLFRDLYVRESIALPWRDVLRALRRLEARGLVRGGRFVSGFSGEQYALPEAVDSLRWVRRQERTGERVWVAASDPLNLVGVVVPGEKVPALAGKGVLYVDGLPVAGATPPTTALKSPVPSRLTPRIAAPSR